MNSLAKKGVHICMVVSCSQARRSQLLCHGFCVLAGEAVYDAAVFAKIMLFYPRKDIINKLAGR